MKRRRFLALGALAPAALVASCSDDPPQPTARPGTDGDEIPEADLDALEFAASLEVAAEAAYRRGLGELTAGRLGEIPPAGSELLQSAATQHSQCLAAINEALEGAGRTATTEADAEFETSVVTPALTAAKSWPEIASLARTIETALAATYLQSIHSALQSPAALRLAGGIQATAQKRVAILNFMLGEYPVPDTFQKTDQARAR